MIQNFHVVLLLQGLSLFFESMNCLMISNIIIFRTQQKSCESDDRHVKANSLYLIKFLSCSSTLLQMVFYVALYFKIQKTSFSIHKTKIKFMCLESFDQTCISSIIINTLMHSGERSWKYTNGVSAFTKCIVMDSVCSWISFRGVLHGNNYQTIHCTLIAGNITVRNTYKNVLKFFKNN